MTASTRPIATTFDHRVRGELAVQVPDAGDTPIWDAVVAELGEPLEDDEQEEAA